MEVVLLIKLCKIRFVLDWSIRLYYTGKGLQMIKKLLISLVFVSLIGCTKGARNQKDVEKGSEQICIEKREAAEVGEQVPPENVIGKTYNGGPLMWWDILVGGKK